MTDVQHLVTAEVHVPLGLAIRSNYGRYGAVPIRIDLATLSDTEKNLLLSWGSWRQGTLGAVLEGTKREWENARDAHVGLDRCKYIVAETVPPSFADVLRALTSRQDREPQHMQYEQERRAIAAAKPLPKRSWLRRLFRKR